MEKISTAEDILVNKQEILTDYRLAYQSRQASLIGRREVLTGKAKFGIFGDGKELAQIAMAKIFKPGDIRSGYYRDQTFMFTSGIHNFSEYFAQLYADADLSREPASGGRQMNAHFATRMLDENGRWREVVSERHTSADVSPTASQMPRLVGLAYASRLYRSLGAFPGSEKFSDHGREIAFGTIGNASAAEGLFWESLNAINALRSPAILSIWDDDFGISVDNRVQFGKELGDLLAGFARKPGEEFGYLLRTVRGWDYASLIQTYQEIEPIVREEHIPAIVHVVELTQPQGHSTSGSHERYKSPDRLKWEQEFDCLAKFRAWIIESDIATEEEIADLEEEDRELVEQARTEAWEAYKEPIFDDRAELDQILEDFSQKVSGVDIEALRSKLRSNANLIRRDLLEASSSLLVEHGRKLPDELRSRLAAFRNRMFAEGTKRYGSFLYSQSEENALAVEEVKAVYSEKSPLLNGFEILNRAFDALLQRDPRVIAFGEDLGKIGGVNQGFAGLQEKYGAMRVSDTGIREATIIGQGIGLALRGFKPIAEIQYLDYLLYAIQIMSDDLATMQWRTVGGQKAPVIVRTRGHRLEGIWHSGSPMGAIIHLLRGMHVIVPRNMVQAAGFYNTLHASDEPGLVVEVLNGYRLKERLPDNIGEMRLPLGVPEVLLNGEDVTIVTYGALCNIAIEAAEQLSGLGISAEVIDVRTLLPFDRPQVIVKSLKKTNRILFLDEDVPGGASAYMLQQVIEGQGGYAWLDSPPITLTSAPHRPAYGSDGSYFSKPNRDTIVEAVYRLMHEAAPNRFPDLYKQ